LSNRVDIDPSAGRLGSPINQNYDRTIAKKKSRNNSLHGRATAIHLLNRESFEALSGPIRKYVGIQ
jgi:hypothetical protein